MRERGKKRDKREERKEREGENRVRGQGGAKGGDFSSSSSFPSALQVVVRERSQRKPRTSKFLMVGKLGFDVFHV